MALLEPLARRFPLAQVYLERRHREQTIVGPRSRVAPLLAEEKSGLQLRVVGARTARLAWTSGLDGRALGDAWQRLGSGVSPPPARRLPGCLALDAPPALPDRREATARLRALLADVERRLGAFTRPRARLTLEAIVHASAVVPSPIRSAGRLRAVLELTFTARDGRQLGIARALNVDVARATSRLQADNVGRDLVDDLASLAVSAKRRVSGGLPGSLPVVLAPAATLLLFHELVGHGLEADQVLTRVSPFAVVRLGAPVAPEMLSIVDSPLLAHGAGGLDLDDEGITPQPTPLIERGVLVGLLSDVVTGLAHGRGSTGNGRRSDVRVEAAPRMRNLVVSPGVHTPDDLRSDIRDGLYVERFGNGRADLSSGRFSIEVVAARRIRRGALAEPLGSFALGGASLAALRAIEGMGSDDRVLPDAVFCAKRGAVVVTGGAAPSVRLRALEVLA